MTGWADVLPCAVLLVAGVVLYALVSHVADQRKLRSWGELARRTGLTLHAARRLAIPYVSGVYRGREVVLDTRQRWRLRHSIAGIRITLRVRNPHNLWLGIRDQTLRDTLGGWLGAADVQTGDRDLDARLFIRANSEVAARRVLAGEALRGKLLAAYGSLCLVLSGHELRFTKDYVETDVQALKSWLDMLSDLAERVEHVDPYAVPPPA